MMLRSYVWEKFSNDGLSLLCSGRVFWKLVEEVLLLTMLNLEMTQGIGKDDIQRLSEIQNLV